MNGESDSSEFSLVWIDSPSRIGRTAVFAVLGIGIDDIILALRTSINESGSTTRTETVRLFSVAEERAGRTEFERVNNLGRFWLV